MSTNLESQTEKQNAIEEIANGLVMLTGLSDQDYVILKEHTLETQKWVDAIFEDFYQAIASYRPAASVFPEGNHRHHEKLLRQWYLQVTGGENRKDSREQWLVGLVHIRRHISNPLMFGTMSRIQQTFLKKCLETFEKAEAAKVYGAFKRVTDVIAGLIAEAYFMNYVDALESVAGFRKSLIEQMMSLEINKRLAESRSRK